MIPTRLRRIGGLLAVVLTVLVAPGCDSTTGPDEIMPRTGRGATLSTTLLARTSVAEINASFQGLGIPIAARYAVALHKVVYETVDAENRMTQASGLLLVPEEAPGARPLLSYQHGTVATRDGVPSAGSAEQIIGLAFATDGYVAALPDLLGLGESPGRHPYVHAQTSATAVVDMLRAVQDVVAIDDGPALNGQLFLVGYSQGGYTVMAAHREIEAAHRDEFQVTASAPMAGPYDLSGVMTTTFLAEKEHPDPYYLPYLMLAYNDIYSLYAAPSVFLAEPYATLLPPLFDGTHGGGAINDVMPAFPVQIFKPDFVEAFRADPAHPLRVRLRENDVYDWTPEAPIRLYHCGADRHVPPENAQVALQRFQERGAAQVTLIEPLAEGDHGTCVAPSLLLAKLWFDGMVQ